MNGAEHGVVNFHIRRVQESDIPLLLEAARESVQHIYPWMPWCHPNLSLAEITAWFRSQQEWRDKDEAHNFVIVDGDRGDLVGGIGLSQINRHYQMANMFYWVRSSYAGRGAASQAIRLVAKFGLKEIGLQRIEIVAAVENLASQRAAEKAGAQKEGMLRKRIILHDKTHDAVLYSLIAEDLD